MFGLIRAKTVMEQVGRLEEELQHHRVLLGDLDDRLSATEKPLKDILVEWDDYYEKFRNLYARIAKRQQRAAEAEQEPSAPPSNGLPSTANPLALQLLKDVAR